MRSCMEENEGVGKEEEEGGEEEEEEEEEERDIDESIDDEDEMSDLSTSAVDGAIPFFLSSLILIYIYTVN
jgi:hypothetical protein